MIERVKLSLSSQAYPRKTFSLFRYCLEQAGSRGSINLRKLSSLLCELHLDGRGTPPHLHIGNQSWLWTGVNWGLQEWYRQSLGDIFWEPGLGRWVLLHQRKPLLSPENRTDKNTIEKNTQSQTHILSQGWPPHMHVHGYVDTRVWGEASTRASPI